MDIINEIDDNVIIVCDNIYKLNILKRLNEKKELFNIKFMTMKELTNSYYFSYDEQAIYYLMNKYNCKYDIAKTYLDNIYFVCDKKYNSNKLNNLLLIKKELDNNNLLIYDKLFKELIKNKTILFYNCELNNYEKNMINDLKKIVNIKIINKEYKSYDHDYYEFNTIDDEVNYVAYKICELIDSGININKIKISNINNDYINTIERIFTLYNLPINLSKKESIFSTKITKEFINNLCDDINNTLDSITKYEGTDTYNKIINICNKYRWCKNYLDIKELLIYDLKHTYIKQDIYKDAIEIIDYQDNNIEDEYVFLMNFNLGQIPKVYKDEDYITDQIKTETILEKTIDKNINEKEIVKKSIGNIKNLIITYKLKTSSQIFYPSNLVDKCKIKKVNINYKKSYSQVNDKILLTKLYDQLVKYGEKSDVLNLLNNNYDIPYMNYKNSFTGVNENNLYKLMNNKLLLSYTSLTSYNECAFKFYLNNILKLNIYEDNFAAVLGTIFHHVLEVGLKKEINIDEEIDKCIDNEYHDRTFTNMEKFFINKTKKDMVFVLDTIKKQMSYCSLDKIETEKSIYVNKDKNISITFMGKIDKMLYSVDDENAYIAIIDYKTGNTDIDLSYVPYGLHMQLPIYMYLSNNMDLNNVKIVGIYLQKVMPKLDKIDKTKSIEEIKFNNLKLEGYSNSDKDILSKLDNGFNNSSVIRSMKTIKDGSFGCYTKTLNDEKISKLIDITNNKIDECVNNILKANFIINPKQEGKNKSITACAYCKYKDICFRTNNDVIKIEPDLELKYLGGDDND